MKKRCAEQKLEKAYFDMLVDTHYSKITVSDIIEKAQVSRTTFYRHYTDIFDMHKKVSDHMAYSIIKKCAQAIVKAQNEDDYFEEVLKIFNTQEKYIILLSAENGSRYFYEAILSNSKKIVSGCRLHFTEDQLFRLRFMTIAMVGVYIKDILTEREHNPYYIKICKKLLNYEELVGGYHTNEC